MAKAIVTIQRRAQINNAARAALFAFVQSLEANDGFTGIKPVFRWNLMGKRAETKKIIKDSVLPCIDLQCKKDLEGLFISTLCRAYERWEERINNQPVKMIWHRLPEDMWSYETRQSMIQNNPAISCGRPYISKVDSTLVQYHNEELSAEFDVEFNEHIVLN